MRGKTIRLLGISPLAQKHLVYVVACSAFFTFIATVFQLYVEYRADVAEIDQALVMIEKSYVPSIASSLFNFDTTQLQLLLDGLSILPDIDYVEVVEQRQNAPIPLASAGKSKNTNGLTHLYPLTYLYQGTRLNLGALSVYVDLSHIRERLLNRLIVIIASNLIKTLLVSLCILLIVQVLTVRHLEQIADFVGRIHLDHAPTPRLALPRRSLATRQPDELDNIVAAINAMSERLRNTYAERLRAQEALRASEERYRAIAETALDSIFCKDADCRYTFVNPAMERLLGIPADQLVGKTPEEIFDTRTAAIIAEVDRPALDGETVDAIKELIIGGTTYTLHTRQVPLHDAAGTIIGLSGIVRDITHQRQVEHEIRRLNDELELHVRQRTAELEAANNELKDFAYVVSHDLKAPLRGISHLAQWLTEDYADTIDDQGREMADLLVGRVKRMDALIDGILLYSRIGRIEEHHERLDLNTLVREVVDDLGLPAHIHVAIANELPVVTAQKIYMTQVFQNLLSNAGKFMDKTDGQIVVRVVEDEACWKFGITDNGPGIDPNHHERIFRIFQTLRPRDEFESTGIGLSIVKKIVERHGGAVWVASQPGEGSTFFFTLPKS